MSLKNKFYIALLKGLVYCVAFDPLFRMLTDKFVFYLLNYKETI